MSRRRDLKKEFGNRWSEEKHERWLFYSQSEHENVEATCRGNTHHPFAWRLHLG